MIETKFPNRLKGVRSFQSQILMAGLVLGSSSVLLLSGCSSGISNSFHGPTGGDGLTVQSLKGRAHGGQFPISEAAVQLYEVGSTSSDATGYASASTALGSAATTDDNGYWTYGSFTCANAADEIYVAASGGNPGLAGDNSAIVLTAALGPCSGLSSISFIFIDEVTTVATEYSLAGFSTDYLHVGTSTTNTIGLTNAFATFNNLVNLNTGQALMNTPAYATPASGTVTDTFYSIVPYDLINSLANVLATCVNSYSASGTSTACADLFQYTGGSEAYPSASITNTANAALYIAHNPGLLSSNNHEDSNVEALLDLVAPTGAPFGPALSTTPNDLTMTVNFVGGGLGGASLHSSSAAQRMAIDQEGNLWIPNASTYVHSVTELNNLGAPLSPSTQLNSSTLAVTQLGGYASTSFKSPNYVAVDLTGNVWVTDSSTSVCLGALNSSGGSLTGSPYSVCPSAALKGVAVDGSNNIYAESATAITSVNQSGNVRAGFPISGYNTLDSYLGVDYSGDIWYVDQGNGHYGAFTSAGTPLLESTPVLPEAAGGWVALGSLSGSSDLSAWITQSTGTQNLQPLLVADSSSAIDSYPSAYLPTSEGDPAGIAADGNSNYYFANAGDSQTGVIINLTVVNDSGSVLSPANGYTGGSALMALSEPNAVAIDQSGNVWVLNQDNANNSGTSLSGATYNGNGVNAANVTEFVGLAAPVNPVFAQDAVNQTYGKKP
ncbi:MAG TPA: hypothetical protein VL986_07155 [Terracidiphilus sp.]|nr:hypothetical protein [Terracidiphilus sp.]